LKYILSGFRSAEIERNNVEGFYNIYDVNNDLGSDSLGDTTNLTGIGHFINHSRNRLLATVISAEHKGIYENIRWGAKVQHEAINDVLNEWTLQDSAGYALPYSESEINLQNGGTVNTASVYPTTYSILTAGSYEDGSGYGSYLPAPPYDPSLLDSSSAMLAGAGQVRGATFNAIRIIRRTGSQTFTGNVKLFLLGV
jgi:hypothetical protein